MNIANVIESEIIGREFHAFYQSFPESDKQFLSDNQERFMRLNAVIVGLLGDLGDAETIERHKVFMEANPDYCEYNSSAYKNITCIEAENVE